MFANDCKIFLEAGAQMLVMNHDMLLCPKDAGQEQKERVG